MCGRRFIKIIKLQVQAYIKINPKVVKQGSHLIFDLQRSNAYQLRIEIITQVVAYRQL